MADTGQVIVPLEGASEWRFELEADENIAIRVHTPDPVYLNGEELPPTTWYPIYKYTKAAVYSPSESKLEVSSMPATQYTSTSTTQPHLISIHLALERLRILAKAEARANPLPSPSADHPRGPRVLVLGPPSSGKTTVVKSLANMALGTCMDWSVGIVGLDPASPANLIPGTLSLSTPSHPIPTHHVAHPLGSPPASSPSNTLSADVPTLGWWYGALEPTIRGTPIWTKIVDAMGKAYAERCAYDPKTAYSGLFIDAPSAFTNPTLGQNKEDPKRYTLLQQAVDNFGVDYIIVIGQEKLTIDLQRHFSPAGVTVLAIPKSGGVVDLNDAYRETAHAVQVRSYFYGEPSLPPELGRLVGRTVPLGIQLSPYSFQIGWDHLHILRVGEGSAAPSTALPLGQTNILSPTRLTRVDPGGPAHVVRLLNTVLAIVALTPEDRITKTTEEPAVKVEGLKLENADVPETEDGTGESGNRASSVSESTLADPNPDEEDTKPDISADTEPKPDISEDADAADAVAGVVELEEDEVPFKEEIGWREVMGFVVITGIDAQKRKYTVLSPSTGKLPSTVAIAGSIEWVDTA